MSIRPTSPRGEPQPIPKQLKEDSNLTKRIALRVISQPAMKKVEPHHEWTKGLKNKEARTTEKIAERVI
jgi:hypothetical protein